jgi:hypothetical protein
VAEEFRRAALIGDDMCASRWQNDTPPGRLIADSASEFAAVPVPTKKHRDFTARTPC